MTADARVHLHLDEGIARVTLHHPPLTVYDLAMRDQLIEALTAARDWPDLRVLMLASAGRHFGVGADISEFGSAPHTLEARRIRWDRDPWWDLRRMPAPTVAVLQGYALGSGLEMALLCDLRIAAADTELGLPEIALGMLPAAGGTQSLTRWIGVDRSAALVLTGRRLTAQEALRQGILHEVAPDPAGRADEIARRLRDLSPSLVGAALGMLRPDASAGHPPVPPTRMERR